MENKNTYNGWKNRQTWNVSLWINNEEYLYRAAVNYMKEHKYRKDGTLNKTPYSGFIKSMRMSEDRTPDNIKYKSTRLDYEALNEMMRDLI